MQILSIQGGGTRGMIAASSLAVLEKKSGPINKQYDMTGGTSVGSFIAAAAASGVPMQGVVDLFYQDGPEIFKPSLWRNLTRLTSAAKYDPAPLMAALTKLLGTRTMQDCAIPFMATAVDMKSGRNVYFQSHGNSSEDGSEIIIGLDAKLSLVDICMASSAAQSYFPGHPIKYSLGASQIQGTMHDPDIKDLLCWDGGTTGCNAPDMLLLTEALEMAWPANEISMLSLGAGETNWKYALEDLTDPSIATVLSATLEAVYSCGEANEVWQAETILRTLGGKHRRINPYIKSSAIDDASKETLGALGVASLAFPI